MSQDIRIRGSEEDIQALRENLESQFPDEDFQFSALEVVKSNPIDRRSHRQIELFDIVLAIGVNLASSAIYDAIKTYLAARNQSSIELIGEDENLDEKTNE